MPHLGDHWTAFPGILRRERVPELVWPCVRWLQHWHGALFTHCSPKSGKMQRAVDELITLLTKVCRRVSRRLSVVLEHGDLFPMILDHSLQKSEKIRVATRRTKEQVLADFRAEIQKHEFQADDDRRSIQKLKISSLKQEKFIVLIKETNNFDEINNSFKNICWNKVGIFMDLMRIVSVRWKNWFDFKAQHSIQFPWENWSKMETLSLKLQARFRNYRMKLIAWMIREIFKMLNQYAVDNPTSPINQCFTYHLSWRNAKPFSWNAEPQQWAAKYLGHACKSGNVFFKSNGVFFSTSSTRVEPMDL